MKLQRKDLSHELNCVQLSSYDNDSNQEFEYKFGNFEFDNISKDKYHLVLSIYQKYLKTFIEFCEKKSITIQIGIEEDLSFANHLFSNCQKLIDMKEKELRQISNNNCIINNAIQIIENQKLIAENNNIEDLNRTDYMNIKI